MRSSGVGRVLHNFHSINWLLNFDFYQLLRNHELVCCVSVSVSLTQYKENRRCQG